MSALRLIGSATVLAAALSVAACRSTIDVRTMAAPDAGLSRLHSFRMLPAPPRRDGRPITGDDDPMIANSIANRAIREQVSKSFLDRGYALDTRNADFVVAVYASAREKLDISAWDYGYPFRPGWPQQTPPAPTMIQYVEGSVIIDVLTPGTRELLWRGEGRADLTDDPADNVRQLVKVAAAVVSKFPQGSPRVVASRR